MIRLLAHSLPPSHVTNLTLFLSLTVCRRSILLTGEKGVKMGVEPKSNDNEKT